MTTLYYQPAHELVEQLKSGSLSSEQLTNVLLDRIEQQNPRINAVVAINREKALDAARKADQKRALGNDTGPLHGLPLTIKDTWEVTGMTCTAGAPALARYTPDRHADVIKRIEDAGAVILGKTNVPLYASDIQTYNKLYGVTNNPHNTDHTCGGSSGGAAAALASGMTPIEIGSDLAGSIRTPSHFCGVFGHKPSRDLISLRGHIPGPPGTQSRPDLAEGGPMARNSRDLEMLLRIIAGPTKLESRSWKLAMEDSPLSSLDQTRVGLWLEDGLCPVDEELVSGYRRLAGEIEQRGGLVSDARHPLLDLHHIMPAYMNLLGSLMSVSMKPSQRRPMKWVARLENLLRLFGPLTAYTGEFARGLNQPIHQWMTWNETREKMRAEIDPLFNEYDVLLAPVTPTAAPRHNNRQPIHRRRITVNGQQRAYMDQFCWIAMATLLGLPATSVPVGKTKEGLPYNIQVIGAAGKDLTTLRFARLLEDAGLAGFQIPEGF
jgi:amidase